MARLRSTAHPADLQLKRPPTIDAALCTGCTQCLLICPSAAIERQGAKCRVLRDRCIHCGRCLWMCPNGAFHP